MAALMILGHSGVGPGRGDRDIWLALRYCGAVSVYGIRGIKPRVLRDAKHWSDHGSFWAHGYGATCLIEDTTGFNPYYHTTKDTVARLSWWYYVKTTKGLLATVAHLAYLQGTEADGDILVRRIAMSRYAAAGKRGALATVRIYDSTRTPVQGARVTGTFGGTSVRTVRALTDGYGRVRLRSLPRAGGGTWTFTVTAVTKPAWTYDPSRNRVTSATITVP